MRARRSPPRSPLSFRELKTRRALGTVVALHGYGADAGQLAPLGESIRIPFDWVMPEAVWPVAPSGPEAAPDDRGYCWRPTGPDGRPDLARLGDSLWFLEQFMLDVVERQADRSAPLFLLGYDQGASLALLLARTMPEFLSGVAAIFPPWIGVPGWAVAVDDLDSLPVLVMEDAGADPAAFSARQAGLFEFARFGADVSRRATPRCCEAAAGWKSLTAWFAAQLDDDR